MPSRVLRCMETMLCGWIALALVFYYELYSVRLHVLGNPSPVAIVPVALMGLAALCMPGTLSDDRQWQAGVLRLKSAALMTLGLAPFFWWHLRSQPNLYLTLGGGLALLAAVWMIMELLGVLELLFARGGHVRQRRAAAWMRQLTAYLLFTPLLTTYGFLLGQMVKDPFVSIHSLGFVWHNLHGLWRTVVTVLAGLPLVSAFFLTWRSQGAVQMLVAAPHRERSGQGA